MVVSRIDNMTKQDKLWELYLHTLAGYHGNISENAKNPSDISKNALSAAKSALKIWEENHEP